MGTDVKNTLFVGDQLFTDIWGANRLGDPDCSGKAHQPKRRDSDRIKTLSGKTGFILLQKKP